MGNLDDDPQIPESEVSNSKADKGYIDILMALASASWKDFDARRNYEWKFNLALWPALALFTVALFNTEHPIHLPLWIGFVLIAVFSAILRLYFNPWTLQLRDRNFKDQNLAQKYWRMVEVELKKRIPDITPRKVPEEMDPLRKAWSHVTQIWITALLVFLAICATIHAIGS